MSEPNLNDIRAVETILTAISPLETKDQVRVLTWVIEKLDLALGIKLAIRDTRSRHRSYIDMAWDKAPQAMHSVGEFLAAAAPETMADRVLAVATFLQLHSDDPDGGAITGKDINASLRKMRLSVPNITDTIYTLMRRTPPHMLEVGRVPGRRDWKGYRVTESGIEHAYEMIVHSAANQSLARRRGK